MNLKIAGIVSASPAPRPRPPAYLNTEPAAFSDLGHHLLRSHSGNRSHCSRIYHSYPRHLPSLRLPRTLAHASLAPELVALNVQQTAAPSSNLLLISRFCAPHASGPPFWRPAETGGLTRLAGAPAGAPRHPPLYTSSTAPRFPDVTMAAYLFSHPVVGFTTGCHPARRRASSSSGTSRSRR
jgi:hypothetical protein